MNSDELGRPLEFKDKAIEWAERVRIEFKIGYRPARGKARWCILKIGGREWKGESGYAADIGRVNVHSLTQTPVRRHIRSRFRQSDAKETVAKAILLNRY